MFKLGNISGKLYHDIDSNGIFNGNDTALTSGKIYLSQNILLLDSTISDTNGNSFSDLLSGTYQISAQSQSLWIQTQPTEFSFYTVVITSNTNASGKISDTITKFH